MNFTPTAEKLIPDLSEREELVLLARSLWREGYSDHLAGHITVRQDDGTLLCNPWLIRWDELRPSQVIRIDLEGNVLEGDWPAPLGIPLHLQRHKMRDDVKWAHLMVEADLELYRATKEPYLLERATKNADHYYAAWKVKPPEDLLAAASIARTLWLMADTETEVGRKFWTESDAPK